MSIVWFKAVISQCVNDGDTALNNRCVIYKIWILNSQTSVYHIFTNKIPCGISCVLDSSSQTEICFTKLDHHWFLKSPAPGQHQAIIWTNTGSLQPNEFFSREMYIWEYLYENVTCKVAVYLSRLELFEGNESRYCKEANRYDCAKHSDMHGCDRAHITYYFYLQTVYITRDIRPILCITSKWN